MAMILDRKTIPIIILMRGGEVVSRKAHNLETGGANPPPATTLSVVKVSLADLPKLTWNNYQSQS